MPGAKRTEGYSDPPSQDRAGRQGAWHYPGPRISILSSTVLDLYGDDRPRRGRVPRNALDRVFEVLRMTSSPVLEDPVTVKLDREIVARLASLKVARGKRSYSDVIRDLLPKN